MNTVIIILKYIRIY